MQKKQKNMNPKPTDKLRQSTPKEEYSTAHRSFLRHLIKLLSLFAVAVILWPVLRFITFKFPKKTVIVIPGFRKLKGMIHKDGAYVNIIDDKIMVLSDRCTHLGCVIRYDPISRQFVCPCHGSKFDLEGKRISGPAKHPLKKLFYKVDKKGNLTILLPTVNLF